MQQVEDIKGEDQQFKLLPVMYQFMVHHYFVGGISAAAKKNEGIERHTPDM